MKRYPLEWLIAMDDAAFMQPVRTKDERLQVCKLMLRALEKEHAVIYPYVPERLTQPEFLNTLLMGGFVVGLFLIFAFYWFK